MSIFWIIRTAASVAPRVPFYLETEELWRRNVSDAVAALNGFPGIPTGTLWGWTGDRAPAGWLICDGTLLRRSDYPALFAVIGEKFGAGDGVTTFAIPTQEQVAALLGSSVPPPQPITDGSIDPPAPVPPPGPGAPPGPGGGGSIIGGRPSDPREPPFNRNVDK